MRKDKSDRTIDELLPRYCEGLVDAEEASLVERWLKEDEKRQKVIDQIMAINLAADAIHVLKEVDTEKALHRVKVQIKGKKIKLWVWTRRVAALLSIPFLLSTLWLYFNQKQPELVQMMEVRTNPGVTTSFVLPDSSVVFLNSESTLRYPSRFDNTREVTLFGEAFFEIHKDTKRSFVVNIPQSKIEVYGTKFNVEAYETEKLISTTLVEGRIGFFYTDAGTTKKVEMKPNQRLTYNSEEHDAKLYSTSCKAEISWKDGMIYLNNTSMKETLHMLEKRFNVEFVVTNRKFYDYSFTGRFTSQRIERIMEYFRISSRIHWRYIDDNNIYEKRQRIELY